MLGTVILFWLSSLFAEYIDCCPAVWGCGNSNGNVHPTASNLGSLDQLGHLASHPRPGRTPHLFCLCDATSGRKNRFPLAGSFAGLSLPGCPTPGYAAAPGSALHVMEIADVPAVCFDGRHSPTLASTAAAIYGHCAHLDRRRYGSHAVERGVLRPQPGRAD